MIAALDSLTNDPRGYSLGTGFRLPTWLGLEARGLVTIHRGTFRNNSGSVPFFAITLPGVTYSSPSFTPRKGNFQW
jgi:hypothetical protein